MRARQQNKPDYGIDAPGIGLAVLIAVILGLAVGVLLRESSNQTARIIATIIFNLLPAGLILIVLMVIYVKVERFRHRDRMLNMLSWKGNEQVLDIGIGRGLLMIGAAKRLTGGRSFGVDIWSRTDLSGNSAEATLRNAEIEGVRDKVEIKDADAQHLPFAENSFDYVLSNLCLHNIDSREGRAAACREIVRVLRPGGVALISDFMYTQEYAATFTEQGLEATRSLSFLLAPMLLRIVRARKKQVMRQA
ncbi:MAG TPA: class I SAM-dependent methyltransferase [Terriglobia bacterium]|nr:class I SAM-dependent methyltransferase [Terriglobia bacterium]